METESRISEINERGESGMSIVPVSIVTPLYNPDKILWETAYSLFTQTVNWKEWIIVNDGTTTQDGLNLISELAKTDSRIQVLNHEVNKGLPAARNTGIDKVTSEYVFFIDGDDTIHSTAIEKMWLLLQANPSVTFANSYVNGFGHRSYKWTGGFYENYLFLRENRNTSCFLARTTDVRNLMFDENMRYGGEDWEFWLHAAAEGYWGKTIPEYLFNYRIKERNTWIALNDKKNLKRLRKQLLQKYKSKIVKNGFPDLRSENPERVLHTFVSEKIKRTEESVLHLPHVLCIFPWLELGGADQFNLNLLSELKKNGWSVTIITSKESSNEWAEAFHKVSQDIVHLPNLSSPTGYRNLLDYYIITRNPTSIFISNSLFAYHILPWLRHSFPSIPVIDFLHCESPTWLNGGFPYLSANLSGFLDKTFVTSAHLRNWCLNRGAHDNKVQVQTVNVDTRLFFPDKAERERIRAELMVDEHLPVLLFAGRLTEQKRPLLFLDILSELKGRGVDFLAILAGGGPDEEKVHSRIKKLKLSKNVKCTGAISNKMVSAYMDAADIFILPSAFEGIALSLFEAMAKGLPVIAADTGGQRELVSEDCGILVKGNDFTEKTKYAEACISLINNVALRKEMAINSRNRICTYFDHQTMVKSIESALHIQSKYAGSGNFSVLIDQLIFLEYENENCQKRLSQPLIKWIEDRPFLGRTIKKIKNRIIRSFRY